LSVYLERPNIVTADLSKYGKHGANYHTAQKKRYYPVAEPVNKLCHLMVELGVPVMGHSTESSKELLHESIMVVRDPFECRREVKIEGTHNNGH
jgi:hypothetical protein